MEFLHLFIRKLRLRHTLACQPRRGRLHILYLSGVKLKTIFNFSLRMPMNLIHTT